MKSGDLYFLKDDFFYSDMPPQKDCNDLILKAINDHLAEKGIDPSTVELKFNGYEVKYDGTNVIVEEWKKL
jgi:hypothetical protein